MKSHFTVGDFMTDKVIVAGLHNKVSEVMRFFATHKIQHLPVTENDELLGIISLFDVLKLVHEELVSVDCTSMKDIDEKYDMRKLMTEDPIFVELETTVADALRLLEFGKFQALPVVSDKKVVGIITNKDLIKVFAKDVNPPHTSFSIENPGFGI